MKALAILVLSAASLSAQSAQYIQVRPYYGDEMQYLYRQKGDIDKQIAALQALISKEYLVQEHCLGEECQSGTKAGWENGFVFTEDWKLIVPRPIGERDECEIGSGEAAGVGLNVVIGDPDAVGQDDADAIQRAIDYVKKWQKKP